MEAIVKTRDDEGSHTLVGITICQGPGRFRMVLTRPYEKAGRIVEIPRQQVESVEPVAPSRLGEIPTPAA